MDHGVSPMRFDLGLCAFVLSPSGTMSLLTLVSSSSPIAVLYDRSLSSKSALCYDNDSTVITLIIGNNKRKTVLCVVCGQLKSHFFKIAYEFVHS